jgi:hypothetical protein
MRDSSDAIDIDLGQMVRLASGERTGRVAGLIFVPRFAAVVRWRDAEVTFEAPDDLVPIVPPVA